MDVRSHLLAGQHACETTHLSGGVGRPRRERVVMRTSDVAWDAYLHHTFPSPAPDGNLGKKT